MSPWIFEVIEILGVISSIIYLYFSIRQNIFLWPMGMISALLYIVVFYHSKFYADMGLNGYYFVISIYGWWFWAKGSSKLSSRESQLPVTRIGWTLASILFVITVVVFLIIGIILRKFTDSPIPYWDAFTTAASITATWMLARKILEHWILWIIIDAVSMGLYLYRGLYPTLILFAVYSTMAVIGFIQWKRSYYHTIQGEGS